MSYSTTRVKVAHGFDHMQQKKTTWRESFLNLLEASIDAGLEEVNSLESTKIKGGRAMKKMKCPIQIEIVNLILFYLCQPCRIEKAKNHAVLHKSRKAGSNTISSIWSGRPELPRERYAGPFFL